MARTYLGHVLLDQLHEKVVVGSTALVVVDMQNDFVHLDGYCATQLGTDLVTGFRTVVAPISRLVAAAHAASIPVVYTKVVQRPDGSLASPVWLADNWRYGMDPLQCMENTWGWEIVDELAPVDGDIVVQKTRRSAFQGTNLENVLQARGVRSLVCVGVAGTGCVESTVRDAIERDYHVVVPGDCVGDSTPELEQQRSAAFGSLLLPENHTTSDELARIWSRQI